MNDFKITISAIDRATAIVKRINGSVAEITRPLRDVQKASKSLGRELGLDAMAKSIANVAGQARGAASEVSKIGAPILALVGGGSIAGIVMLANQWGRLGSEVGRTSQTLGIASSQLQTYRGAAQIAGVSSEELTGGIRSLGDTMQDAFYGRNQDALGMLNKLGIGIHKTADGSIDASRGMYELADAIAATKSAQTQGVIARGFGLESSLPLLRLGSKGIMDLQRQARALGAEMSQSQIARAERFGVALNYLDLAGQGLRNTIGNALIPVFQPLIEDMTSFIGKNREAIGSQIGIWAKDFAAWLREVDFKGFYQDLRIGVKGVGEFVDSIGGWKVAAIGIGAVMAGPLLLSITNIGLGLTGLAIKTIPLAVTGLGLLGTAMGGAEVGAGALLGKLGLLGAALGAGWWVGNKINEQLDKRGISIGSSVYDLMNPEQARSHVDQTGSARGVVDFFKAKGWSEAQALGIAANLKKESGFNTAAVGDNGNAYGVAQWHDDRQRAFKKWSGKNIREANLEEQLGFVNYEMTQGAEKRAGDALRGATDERQAASIVSRLYERPANADSEAAGRAKAATEMKQSLEIRLSGLPAGTTATARRADGTNVPVSVGTTLATGP